jgi:hypothetical protein
MLEMIQQFESVMIPAAQDHPLVVIAPGSAAVAAGLLVWLGGLGFKRVLMAISGAAGGAALGYFVIGRSVLPTIISAIIAAGIASMFERVFIALIAAMLVAGLGITILAGRHINIKNAQNEPEGWDETTNSDESMKEPDDYLFEVGVKAKAAVSDVPVYQWLIVGLMTVLFLVGVFVFRRFGAALCFSALGTLFIAGGMVLLLFYKGSTPLSWIASRPLMYAGIAGGMTAFGTVEQLLFCRGGIRKPATKKSKTKNDGAGKKKRRTV